MKIIILLSLLFFFIDSYAQKQGTDSIKDKGELKVTQTEAPKGNAMDSIKRSKTDHMMIAKPNTEIKHPNMPVKKPIITDPMPVKKLSDTLKNQ